MFINDFNFKNESIDSILKTVDNKKRFLSLYKDCLKQILEDDDCNNWLTKLYSFNRDVFNHSVNVSLIGAAIVYNEKNKSIQMIDVVSGGLFHDIGKSMISKEILFSKTKLSEHEKHLVSLHPEFGYNILSKIPISNNAKRGVLFHHENFGGNGYPKQKQQQDIPLIGRILKIADVYDALVSKRTYKKEQHPKDAALYITQNKECQFDSSLLMTMKKVIDFYCKEDRDIYGRVINKTKSCQNH